MALSSEGIKATLDFIIKNYKLGKNVTVESLALNIHNNAKDVSFPKKLMNEFSGTEENKRLTEEGKQCKATKTDGERCTRDAYADHEENGMIIREKFCPTHHPSRKKREKKKENGNKTEKGVKCSATTLKGDPCTKDRIKDDPQGLCPTHRSKANRTSPSKNARKTDPDEQCSFIIREGKVGEKQCSKNVLIGWDVCNVHRESIKSRCGHPTLKGKSCKKHPTKMNDENKKDNSINFARCDKHQPILDQPNEKMEIESVGSGY